MSPRPRFASLPPQRSAAILRAAAEELATHGLAGASTNRIIARAGVSKGALYYYFDDKQDLFLTALRDAVERAAAEIGELRHFDDARSFWDAMQDLYERITSFVIREPVIAGLLKVALAQPPGGGMDEVIRAYIGRARTGFRNILAQGVRLGAVRDDLPLDLLIDVVFAIGDSMDRWTLAHWDSLGPEELAAYPRRILGMHLRAIAPGALLRERIGESDRHPEPD